jgi:membrane-associated phospholipid phosphatase
MIDSLAATDQTISTWFHAHLTPVLVTILRALCEPGSSEWIGVALFFGVLFFVWKRSWPSLATLLIAVPGGMLLNELIKILVHRQRPFVDGSFVDWSGYSFASGHTIAATLFYGQLLLFLIPVLKSRHWKRVAILLAVLVVLLVGFGRIALGAHYLTDVLAALFLGILWLAFCAFMMQPVHRRAMRHKLALAGPEAVALVPVPAAETTESSQALSH